MLAHTDAATGKPFVDVVLDQAEQKGTGRWTVQSALDLGVPITGIAEATFARSLSGHADQREAARARRSAAMCTWRFGLADRDALRRGRAQARCTRRRWSPTRRASTTSPPAARSTTGTSTGARWRPSGAAAASSGRRFLDRIREAYDSDPRAAQPAGRPYFAAAVRDGLDSWRRVVAQAAAAGIPAPAFSASLAYYDGLRRKRLPAALIQGLRDNFGAHTYRRSDADGSFHTEWAYDLRERPA